jgi:hypothetical protein
LVIASGTERLLILKKRRRDEDESFVGLLANVIMEIGL